MQVVAPTATVYLLVSQGEHAMALSRRDLLSASALLLAGPGLALRAAAKPGAAPGPIVLCWNENPYGPSPAARAAVSESVPDACRYPDDEMATLVAALAAMSSNAATAAFGSRAASSSAARRRASTR